MPPALVLKRLQQHQPLLGHQGRLRPVFEPSYKELFEMFKRKPILPDLVEERRCLRVQFGLHQGLGRGRGKLG